MGQAPGGSMSLANSSGTVMVSAPAVQVTEPPRRRLFPW
jgi:hypothetical protein